VPREPAGPAGAGSDQVGGGPGGAGPGGPAGGEGGDTDRPGGQRGPAGGGGGRGGRAALTHEHEPSAEEIREAQAEMDAVREQLQRSPAELVIANHAMGLWELAALHLSHDPPQLPQAQLAIDALSALVEGLKGRLGEAEPSLSEGLAEIRMAFVQVAKAERSRQGPAAQTGGR